MLIYTYCSQMGSSSELREGTAITSLSPSPEGSRHLEHDKHACADNRQLGGVAAATTTWSGSRCACPSLSNSSHTSAGHTTEPLCDVHGLLCACPQVLSAGTLQQLLTTCQTPYSCYVPSREWLEIMFPAGHVDGNRHEHGLHECGVHLQPADYPRGPSGCSKTVCTAMISQDRTLQRLQPNSASAAICPCGAAAAAACALALAEVGVQLHTRNWTRSQHDYRAGDGEHGLPVPCDNARMSAGWDKQH